MSSNSIQLAELLDRLQQTKKYLVQKSQREASYQQLINTLELEIDCLLKHQKLQIKLVATSEDLVIPLKKQCEANSQLRSLYNFTAIAPFKNIPQIIQDCCSILIVFQSKQTISNHHYKLIDLAQKSGVQVYILIKKKNINDLGQTFTEYIQQQKKSLYLTQFLLPINDFFDLNDSRHIQIYQQFFLNQSITFTERLIQQQSQKILNIIDQFFTDKQKENWQKIKQIKQEYLQQREIHNYQQQVLQKTFNQIHQQQQQTILSIKQAINQSRHYYLNPFKSDSWIFELQNTIEQAQTKLVKEKSTTYLYLIIENGDILEYFHSYILNLYQQKITEALAFQWSKINHFYDQGGLEKFIIQTNQKIATIELLKSCPSELIKIELNSQPNPQLYLEQIIDIHCLKANSKLIFDYSYLQSSWFKLLISCFIGISVYLFTKLYSGTGRYVGFFILIFQIINLLTGQSIKDLKLKSHRKELQRTISHKYQALIRLILEQIIQTLIICLDQQNKLYKARIDTIMELAQTKLDEIKQEISQYQSRQNQLEQDQLKVKSWLD